MWREMLAATVRLETRFAVAVFAPSDAQGFWDLARDHYGSLTPMSRLSLDRPGDPRGQRKITPRSASCRSRMTAIPTRGGVTCRRMTRTPRGSSPGCRSAPAATPAATAATRWRSAAARSRRPAATGPFSSPNRRPASAGRGFSTCWPRRISPCTFFAGWEHAEGAANLIEVDGLVNLSDPRLQNVRARLGRALHRLLPFGGYALPLPAALLSSDAAKG